MKQDNNFCRVDPSKCKLLSADGKSCVEACRKNEVRINDIG